MAVQTASQDLADQYGVDFHDGVMVVSVEQGSPADIEGITPGTILFEINHETIKTADDFGRIRTQLQGRTKAIAMIGYDYKGNVKYFAVKPD